MSGKSTPKPDITRLLDLQNFLNNFHFIERIVYLPTETQRAETDTEHSYTLAMTAWFLAQYFPELDTNKCIRYALVHDLVEIYAGDTFAFAEQKDLEDKKRREAAALKRVEKEWKDFPEMLEAMKAYDKHEDAESYFIYALDKIMPSMLNFLNKGYVWKEYKISFEQHQQKKLNQMKKSPQAEHYYKQLEKILEKHPHYFHPSESN